MHAVFNGINDAIKQAARRAGTPSFTIADDAPSTFQDVLNHYKSTGSLVIWSGGSETCIYNDLQVNCIFRAWHDWTHIQTLQGFDLQGETATAYAQMRQVGDNLARIIELEVIKQAEYHTQTGMFIENQIEWTIKQLSRRTA